MDKKPMSVGTKFAIAAVVVLVVVFAVYALISAYFVGLSASYMS